MGLIVPMLIAVILVPDSRPSDRQLADFSRIARAVDQSIYLVDQNGYERLMRLVAATPDAVTLELGPQTMTLARDEVLRVDLEQDRTIDGFLKGVAFGAGFGLLVRGLGGGSAAPVFEAMAVYGGIGYLLDRSNQSRSPIYRAPAPTAVVTVRF